MYFSSDTVYVARGEEDHRDHVVDFKARMDYFDHSSSNYLCNKGCWITAGSSSSEPITVG